MQTKDTDWPAPSRVAYLNCNDATLFVTEARLSPEEADRLAAVLAWLEGFGGLLRPADLAEPEASLGFG